MTNNVHKKRLTATICLLAIPGIGRGRYQKLMRLFKSPENVLVAEPEQLRRVAGISETLANDIVRQQNWPDAEKTAEQVLELGWDVYLHGTEIYPQRLSQIPEADIPPLLFGTGKTIDFSQPMVAIVGSRHATEQGRQFAYNLAYQLTRNSITVVSGMAEGIDSHAHKGALDGGGKTVAVWGSSLDIVYPPSNKELSKQITKNGTLLSEYPPGTKPDRTHFPERNRIISGLSEGVVVVEAGIKSGALITAAEALQQGRELFAVPGAPGNKMSLGTNELIKKGAKLITSIDDIFEELPRLKGKIISKQFQNQPDLTEMERKLIDLFQNGPQQVDNIARITDLPVSELMEFLLALELKGILREISGKRFALVDEHA